MNSFFLFNKAKERLKLRLSEKGVIVASCPKLAARLQAELLSKGVKYNIASHTRDLGISYTAGRSKPNQFFSSRFRDKKGRMLKIGRLARICRKARKLFSGSGFSSSTFGHQVCGLTQTEMVFLEQHGARSSGITLAGRCRYTANCMAY